MTRRGPYLTARQHQIVAELAMGFTAKEIAERLGIAEATVKTHVQDMLRRTHSANRTHLVARWIKGDFGPMPIQET